MTIAWSKPAFAMGDFVVLAGETFAAVFRRPFALRGLQHLKRAGLHPIYATVARHCEKGTP